MDSTLFHTLFDATKGMCAAFIAVICMCRAAKMDNRVRPLAQWTFILLGVSAAGLGLAPLMERWMLHVCVIAFMFSVCILLIEGEKRWRNGIPDELLKDSERYPFKDRRKGDRRGHKPPDDSDGEFENNAQFNWS